MPQFLASVLIFFAVGAALTMACQSPTNIVPGDKGPQGAPGLPGSDGDVTIVLRNTTIFGTPAGRKRRASFENAITLQLDPQAYDIKGISNNYAAQLIALAEKNEINHDSNDKVFMGTANAVRNERGFKVFLVFQETTSCSDYLDAVKIFRKSLPPMQFIELYCDGQIY